MCVIETVSDLPVCLVCVTRDSQWQYLTSQYNRARQTHSDSGLQQVLYMAVVMFMQSFYLYVSHIDTDISGRPLHISGRPLHISGRPLHISCRPLHISCRPLHISGRPLHISKQ